MRGSSLQASGSEDVCRARASSTKLQDDVWMKPSSLISLTRKLRLVLARKALEEMESYVLLTANSAAIFVELRSHGILCGY